MMAKMAKAVGFGTEAPAVQLANPVPDAQAEVVAPAAAAAPAAPAGPATQVPGSDLWHVDEQRELELPERRLFGRRRHKYVGSHRPQEKPRARRSERKRRPERTRTRPEYGFDS
jgi:hypothetical protein